MAFDRATAIGRLVSCDMDTILNQHYDDYLYEMLLVGFKGYENLTEEELVDELLIRDIVLGDFNGN
jgi:hypothetical protein